MKFNEIVQIVGLVLEALKALENSGLLQRHPTIVPKLTAARLAVATHLAESKPAAKETEK